MQYKVKINDQEREMVAKKKESGEIVVQLGEKTYTLQGARLPDGRLSAVIDGKRHTFAVQAGGGEKTVFYQGIRYQLQDATQRRAGRGGSGGAQVTPPMPGVIVKILVEEGQRVQAKQEVIVMSAMKMETTLSAPHDALVQKILVREGEQVTAGQQLIEFAQVSDE